MKYNKKEFDKAVTYYKKKIAVKKKNILLSFDVLNTKAFLSIAPLSRAAHELGNDLYVIAERKGKSRFNTLHKVWNLFENKDADLIKLIKIVDKKTKNKFSKLFKRADLVVEGKTRFSSINADYKTGWFKKYKWKSLQETAAVLWDQVFNLKKTELVDLSFDLIPTKKDLTKPLEDYLDSFAIVLAMRDSVRKQVKAMGAGSKRDNVSQPMERVRDLSATLTGLEYEKNIDEPIFKIYKKLSARIGTDNMKISSASFGAWGQGYGGKHLFGDAIGYPTPNKKARWSSPGEMFYKFFWLAQTPEESRDPQSRIGFTSTVPLDIFIKSSNIDWMEMAKKNKKIADIMNRCQRIFVKGKKTDFEVALLRPDGVRRMAKVSDVETRQLVKIEEHNGKKLRTGSMSNIPGGEAFTTPEYINGTFYGDVVISIDDSFNLSAKQPLIVKCDKKGYKLVKGPKKVVAEIKKHKKEAWKKLLDQEKQGSLPKFVIDMKKRNFNKIGEFAINTNPKAELCDYLIVNEKIANMIHIALGSGFDPDRATVYHYDIVINAKMQKLDIYGVDAKGKERWILKKGKFVI